MRLKATAWTLAGMLALTAAATAQEKPAVPPPNAMKLSDIIATVEGRTGFQYVFSVEWNEDGYYDVVYWTDDRAKVEMMLDPVTGKAK